MFNKKTVKDMEVAGKRVLLRVDFNVPMGEDKIADDTRIRNSLPTIKYLLACNAAIILCSHLGRPKGKKNTNFSLKPVSQYLGKILGRPVTFIEDCIGPRASEAAAELQGGEILVLENTRFHPGEKANDPKMAEKLASLADLFINDAFGAAHRAHASNVGVADYLPSAAGLLMEKEIKYLGQAISEPKRPFVAILGGAKVSDKIGVIKELLKKTDTLLIGGGMANTFFKAQGYPVGDSLVEEESLKIARSLLEQGNDKLRLPVDVVIGAEFKPDSEHKTINMGSIPDGWGIYDIGPETIIGFSKVLAEAGMIVWNGPMGVFEFPIFSTGTFDLAKEVARSSAVSIVGGGDSVSAVIQSGLADQITHISTGGGAFLEMVEGKILPGLNVLEDK